MLDNEWDTQKCKTTLTRQEGVLSKGFCFACKMLSVETKRNIVEPVNQIDLNLHADEPKYFKKIKLEKKKDFKNSKTIQDKSNNFHVMYYLCPILR
jgi:hypothetical protein